jgi:hypothetical protein
MDQDIHGRDSGHSSGCGHASYRSDSHNFSSSSAPATAPAPAADESLTPSLAPRTILIGQAGVHLIMSKLLAWNIPAVEAMSGLPYDIIADVPGTGFVRIQVKTTTRIRYSKLRFRMQRGSYYSPRGLFDYKDTDFDIAAFVYLPTGQGVFWANPPRDVAFFPAWLEPPNVDHTTWLWALNEHALAMRERAAPQLTKPTAMAPIIFLWPPRAPWAPPVSPEPPTKPKRRRPLKRACIISRTKPITIKGSRLP